MLIVIDRSRYHGGPRNEVLVSHFIEQVGCTIQRLTFAVHGQQVILGVGVRGEPGLDDLGMDLGSQDGRVGPPGESQSMREGLLVLPSIEVGDWHRDAMRMTG